jgi:hypothetical protein
MKKKVLKSIIIIVLVLVILVVMLIHLFGDRALKAGIETAATKALGVDVTIGDLSLSLLKGKLELRDLVIDNPPGYQHPELLNFGRANINISVTSLLSDTVEIEQMQFEDITMVIEQKGLTNNLKEVLNALPSGQTAPKDTTDEPDTEAKKLHIDNLEISNVTVKAKLLPIPGKADTVTLKVAPIKMTDLGSDDKLSTAKLTGKVLAAIATGVAKQGGGLLPKDLVGSLNTTLKDKGALFIDTGKEVFESSKDIGKDALDSSKDIGKDIIEGGKDVGEGVGEALKGLFKK